MTAVIEFKGVTKRYRAQTALDNVSFTVPSGVVFALLGENGAGKTTTIRSILGLQGVDQGLVRVLGRESAQEGRAIRRQIGYVSEQPVLYDWMTVDEIGWFTAGFYEAGFWDGYQRLVQQFELDGTKKLKSLSKGTRAKVGLSLALAHDPELLILDEPTSGLDALVRREFLGSMVERASAGKTVFLSSHQIHEVERVADVVAILREGQLLLVERLEVMKREIRELTVTLANGEPQPPAFPGEILRQEQRQRQWQLFARNAEEDDLAAFRSHGAIAHVDIRTPTLEEIFVAVMRDSPDAPADPSVEQYT